MFLGISSENMAHWEGRGLPAGIFTIDALTWVYVGIFRPECCGLRELIHVLLMLVISNQPKNSNDQ